MLVCVVVGFFRLGCFGFFLGGGDLFVLFVYLFNNGVLVLYQYFIHRLISDFFFVVVVCEMYSFVPVCCKQITWMEHSSVWLTLFTVLDKSL